MTTLIDIVFQSGDFINEQSTNIIEKVWTFIVSFCGIGIPLLLFFLGLSSQRNQENKRKADRQFDNLKYFAILIENITALCSQQSENCKDVANKIVKNPIDFPDLEKIVGTDIKRIVSLINHEDIFHAYIAKFGNTTEKIKDFRIIFSYLDYLDKIYDEHLQGYENYKDKFDNKYNEYIKVTTEIMDYVVLLMNKIKNEDVEYKKNNFWNFLFDLIQEYHTKRKDGGFNKIIDIDFDFKNFIEPIRVGLIQNFKDNINFEYIILRVKQATSIHTQIIALSVKMNKDFITYQDAFSKINTKIGDKTIDIIKVNAT
jgi:hypothetical protein